MVGVNAKDVECCFGILKGRFCILKYGIRLYGIEKSDIIWKTCCALHNVMLDVDGLCDGWEVGNRSVCETELDDRSSLPFALKRLVHPGERRHMDTSNLGLGNVTERTVLATEEREDDVGYVEVHNNIVRNMSMDQYRDKLIKHFNIAFMKKEIQWPGCIYNINTEENNN